MSEPLVCAVMLVNGRPEMVKRAVASFRAQTYPRKSLLVLNSGPRLPFPAFPVHLCTAPKSVGSLRNQANSVPETAKIICHFDSDDWSHPNRIAEQVALLQSSGADAVGYREVMFWRQPSAEDRKAFSDVAARAAVSREAVARAGFCSEAGEAWLFTHPQQNWCHGASLCYWRQTWERKPFPDTSSPGNPRGAGEDLVWQAGLKRTAVSAIEAERRNLNEPYTPRLICGIHGGNTATKDLISPEWRRVAEWDERVRAIMEAKCNS